MCAYFVLLFCAESSEKDGAEEPSHFLRAKECAYYERMVWNKGLGSLKTYLMSQDPAAQIRMGRMCPWEEQGAFLQLNS